MSKELFMLSEKIKKLREDAGITQAELGRRLGISRSGVNSWEMGLSIPSTQYIVELANCFKVSADYLLNIDANAFDNYLERTLIDVFRSMNIEQQKIFVEQGKVFLSLSANKKERLS